MDQKLSNLRRQISVDPQNQELKRQLGLLCEQIGEFPTDNPGVVPSELLLSFEEVCSRSIDLGYSLNFNIYEAISGDKIKCLWEKYFGSYQGDIAGILKFDHPRYGLPVYMLIDSYFGSCEVCDGYMGQSEKSRYDMLYSIMQTPRQFWSMNDLREHIKNSDSYDMQQIKHDYSESWPIIEGL